MTKKLSVILIKNKKTLTILGGLFILAIILRFLFFPQNTQFAYDHARDAFIGQQVLAGEFKIIGPPTTANPHLNHGALFYYIAAPIYALSGGNPEGLSMFLRIYNAIGVFLIFLIGWALANKRIGFIAAFLYTISFEQTQFGLFMGHPTMAVLTTMLFFLGLTLYIFRKKSWGLILSAIGFGLSMQFHMGLLYLAPLFLIYFIVFRKRLSKISIKTILFTLLGFAIATSTFILADLKYNFRTIHGLIALISDKSGDTTSIIAKAENLNFIVHRYFTDNFILLPVVGLALVILGLIFFWLIRQKNTRPAGIFLLIWFVWGLTPYYLTNSHIYFYGVGTSISLLILASFVVYYLFQKNKYAAVGLLVLFLFSNLFQITTKNPQGPINAITSQDGMLLKDEKAIIDYTYQKANGKEFAINALTVPYSINTTWSYLYDWYGKKTYGYVPIWGGSHATGFHTALQVNTARSTLPEKRFLIIEDTQGLPESIKEDFMKEENTYSETINTTSAGLLKVYEQKSR